MISAIPKIIHTHTHRSSSHRPMQADANPGLQNVTHISPYPTSCMTSFANSLEKNYCAISIIHYMSAYIYTWMLCMYACVYKHIHCPEPISSFLVEEWKQRWIYSFHVSHLMPTRPQSVSLCCLGFPCPPLQCAISLAIYSLVPYASRSHYVLHAWHQSLWYNRPHMLITVRVLCAAACVIPSTAHLVLMWLPYVDSIHGHKPMKRDGTQYSYPMTGGVVCMAS